MLPPTHRRGGQMMKERQLIVSASVELPWHCQLKGKRSASISIANHAEGSSTHVKHGSLRFENGSPSHGADFYGGHRAADVQVVSVLSRRFQYREAVGACDVLCWILHSQTEFPPCSLKGYSPTPSNRLPKMAQCYRRHKNV